VTQQALDVCAFWGAKTPAAVERQPVRSDIPTLVVAADYDPITPPANGQMAAQTLSRHYFLEFPGFGHGVYGPCWSEVTTAFLDAPLQTPDSSCVEALPPLKFFGT
jgi:pimeloyl-ACP methyl ester carboxylesterase